MQQLMTKFLGVDKSSVCAASGAVTPFSALRISMSCFCIYSAVTIVSATPWEVERPRILEGRVGLLKSSTYVSLSLCPTSFRLSALLSECVTAQQYCQLPLILLFVGTKHFLHIHSSFSELTSLSYAPSTFGTQMNVLEGSENPRASAIDQVDLPEEDSVYVNPCRSPTKQKFPQSGDKRSTSATGNTHEEPYQKRQRPIRACASSKYEPNPSAVQPPNRSRHRSIPPGLTPISSKPASHSREHRKFKTMSAKVSSPKLAYNSVDEAIREQRLFHSVLQTPVRLEEIEAKEDSDAEECLRYEREWRLAIANDEVNDFTDTLPVEKLFFNLWNQFLTMEFHAYADKTVPPACMQFVKSMVECIMALSQSYRSSSIMDSNVVFVYAVLYF